MASKDVIFRLSKEVPETTQEFLEYTPVSGTPVNIVALVGESNFTVDSIIKVVWDFGGANEEVLWSIKGSGIFTETMIIPKEEVDGIRKLALVIENGETKARVMSAYMKIRAEDNG